MATAIAPPNASDGEHQAPLILSPEQRKELLGRLAEFEMALLNLPPREQGFVLAYISDPTNGKRAAIKAGMPEKSAEGQAHKLLKVPRVAHAIALGSLIREDRTFVTSERTIHELAIIAFANIDDYRVVGGELTVKEGVPEYALRAVQSAVIHEKDHYDRDGKLTHTSRIVRIRLWSKTDTLRMLALYQKLISNALVGNVNIDARQVHLHEWSWGNRKLTF